MSKKPTTVTEYINDFPIEARKKLREVRSLLKKAAPKALILKVAKFRVKDLKENDTKWM